MGPAYGTACTPAEGCDDPDYSCVRVDSADRAGTCLRRCGPVDVGACAQTGCAPGFMCIYADHFPVVARDVCVPLCSIDDDSACYEGTTQCAPEVRANGEQFFRCEDDRGAAQYVCLP